METEEKVFIFFWTNLRMLQTAQIEYRRIGELLVNIKLTTTENEVLVALTSTFVSSRY
jgi:hypothetical protein